MKKKFLKLFAMIFSVALLVTGCATVSSVYDENGDPIYFETPTFFGGQVAKIGNYLYYANGYTDASADSFDYNTAAQTGYLARIDLSTDFVFDEETEDSLKPNTSPENSEKVSDRFVGYQNQNMFAYGSYLYFTSTNTHRTSSLENDYSRVTLFRVAFNGDNLTEIYTTRYDDSSSIEVVEGSDGNYYYVICAQNSEEEYELSSIKIGDSLGSRVLLAENVESYAIADENSSSKNVIYSATNDDGEIEIKAVDFATEEKTDYSYATSMEISFLDRVGDIVFYSADTANSDIEIYYKDVSTFDTNFDASNRFFSADSISEVLAVEGGYVFVSGNGGLIYKTLNGSSVPLLSSDTTFDLLFERDGWIYYSSSTEINRISVVDQTIENVITMTSMISGACGYSDGYIYFFAQLEETESDSSSEDATADENYYLYRASLDGTGNYQLIGKTI